MLTNLLISKLTEKGLVISAREKAFLRKKVLEGDYSRLTLRPWKFWKRKRIEVEITDGDLQSLEASAETLTQKLPEIIERVSVEAADLLLRSLRKRWPRESGQQRREMQGFLRRLDRRWREPFGLLQMLLTIAMEFGENANEMLRSNLGPDPHKTDVLTRLHARACQVGSEVLALLRQGFADGALARWRTLHEIAVISLFIAENDDSLAEQYSLHQFIESWRAAREYDRFRDRLGYEPLDPAELVRLEQTRAALVDRFGEDFTEPCGWAARLLGISSPNFADIERAVGVDHLRPFYRMASHTIHANPKGTFFKLGLVGEEDLLLTGPSNTGFADAGQNTALSIVQATSSLGILAATLDTAIVLQLMMKLADHIGENFVAVQNQIEARSYLELLWTWAL